MLNRLNLVRTNNYINQISQQQNQLIAVRTNTFLSKKTIPNFPIFLSLKLFLFPGINNLKLVTWNKYKNSDLIGSYAFCRIPFGS